MSVSTSTMSLPDNAKFDGEFYVTAKGHVLVYTDGCCLNNQHRAQARGGMGVYFGPNHPKNLSLPLRGKRQTNNRTEILDAYFALKTIFSHGRKRAHVVTDSKFLIDCIRIYMRRWKRNGFKTEAGRDVKNKEELELLNRYDSNMIVHYEHVKRGIHPWNIAADDLARKGAMKE